jgi:hypothetical protein
MSVNLRAILLCTGVTLLKLCKFAIEVKVVGVVFALGQRGIARARRRIPRGAIGGGIVPIIGAFNGIRVGAKREISHNELQ